MNSWLLIWLRGLLVGFSIAAPIGPIGVLCIRQTLAHGRLAGFFVGLGAACADAIYGSMAAFGVTFLAGYFLEQQAWLRLVGGVFLVYLGLRTWLAKTDVNHNFRVSQRVMGGVFLSSFLLTLTNPMTIVSFSAVIAGLGDLHLGYLGAALLVFGVFVGSAAWWFLLSGFVTRVIRQKQWGMKWVNILSGAILITFGIFVLFRVGNAAPSLQSATLATPEAAPAAPDGYARADGSLQLQFPQDHGPHPDYQTEWWYYTGNLTAEDGRRFGYQLTFFRRALLPPKDRPERESDWATTQAYMVHFALTDVAANRHFAVERLARGAAGLAGAQSAPFQVWLEDWSVSEIAPGVFHLQAALDAANSEKRFTVDLVLTDKKGPILQGEQGYSQKGPDRGNASYYYSMTRLESEGLIITEDRQFNVRGSGWMDHEFSTSVLAGDQVGWDWFSIQLEDRSELMVFQIRKADGSIDPFSSGAYISDNGASIPLKKDHFVIRVLDTWQSPETRGVYPARWQVTVPELSLVLEIEPLITDQELNLSYAYWEGAVCVQALKDGVAVNGVGYIELTGYAGSMSGEF